MTSKSIVSRLLSASPFGRRRFSPSQSLPKLLYDAQLSTLLREPERLPFCVQQDPVALRYLELLAPLDWVNFPERNLDTAWCLPTTTLCPFRHRLPGEARSTVGLYAASATFLG